MNRKIAYYGLLVALAFIFSYVESLFPINLGIPGVKLGLANLVVIVSLYLFGIREAAAISFIRIVLSGITFGSPAAMVYSLAGGVLSLLIMVIARKTNKFSTMGVICFCPNIELSTILCCCFGFIAIYLGNTLI